MKDLVEQSPFSFPGVENFIYIGSKVTKIFKLDSETGEILESDKLKQNPEIGNNINFNESK